MISRRHEEIGLIVLRGIGPLRDCHGEIGPVVRREEVGLIDTLEDSVVLTRVRIVLECSGHLVKGRVGKIEVLLVHRCRQKFVQGDELALAPAAVNFVDVTS